MIELLWKSGKAKGYTDLLPSDWFENEGHWRSLRHAVRGPRGGMKLVRCALRVNGGIADVDYGGDHTAFNKPIFDVGVIRMVFENTRRKRVQQFFWKDADARQFVEMTDGDVEWRNASDPESTRPFNPTNLEDGRKKIERMVTQRQGQPAFRNALLAAYNNRCAITGCTIDDVLEAAHISPYLGKHTNHVTNGLLLRADVHTLFDRGLIKIHRDYRVTAQDDVKAIYELPASITVPKNVNCRPDKKALGIKAKLP